MAPLQGPSFLDVVNCITNCVTCVVTVVGILFVLIRLHHMRSANFVSAWLGIVGRLQDKEKSVSGRALLRNLYYRKRGEQAEDSDVLSVFQDMKSKYGAQGWYRNLDKEITAMSSPKAKADLLREVMAEAVGDFDLTGILAIHSKIPRLVDVVVIEWLDSIIACFEQGKWVIRRRLEKLRFEQFQCFSVLYVRALRRKRELGKLIQMGDSALIGDAYPSPKNLWGRFVDWWQMRRDSRKAAEVRRGLLQDFSTEKAKKGYVFCPHCGSNLSGNTCVSCHCSFHPSPHPNVSALIYDPSTGELLLVKEEKSDKENPSNWEIPGGFANVLSIDSNPGESLEDALTREMKEELGADNASLLIQNISYLGSFGDIYRDGTPIVVIYFLFLVSKTDITAKSGKHVSMNWFSLDCLPSFEYSSDQKAVSLLRGKILRAAVPNARKSMQESKREDGD